MRKGEIRKKATELIKSGVSHNEVYERLKSDDSKPKPSDILRVIKQIPSLAKRNKYNTIRVVLLVLLGIHTLSVVALGVSLYVEAGTVGIVALIIGLGILTMVFIGVYNYSVATYRVVAILTALGWVRSLPKSDFSDPFTIGGFLFALVVVVLAGIMTLKLEMKYRKVPTSVIGDDGVQRKVTKVVFEKEEQHYNEEIVDEV